MRLQGVKSLRKEEEIPEKNVYHTARIGTGRELANMKIELNLYASLARYLPREAGAPRDRIWEVDEGTTIFALLHRHQVPLDKVKLIFLNGLHARGDEILREGDRVGVFPPVAGG